MTSTLVFIGFLIDVAIALSCLFFVACMISHIVRRHILLDRQQDLVSKINWNIQQKSDENEIEALKFEERNVTSMISNHNRLIVTDIVLVLVLAVVFVIISIVFGTGMIQ